MKSFLDNFITAEVPSDGPKIVSQFYTHFDYDNDQVNHTWDEGSIPEINVKVEQHQIRLDRRQVSSTVSMNQIDELSKFGVDGKSSVISALKNEASVSEIKDIIREVKLVSKEYYRHKKFEGIEKWFYDLIGFKRLKTLGESDILNELLIASNQVHVNSRRGPGKFVIVSREILSYIIDNPMFVFSSTGDITGGTISNIGIAYHVGSLPARGIDIYESLELDSREMIVGGCDSHSGIISVKTPQELKEVPSVDYHKASDSDNVRIQLTWWGQVSSTPNSSELYVKFKYAKEKESVWSYIGNHILGLGFFQNLYGHVTLISRRFK